MSLIIYVPLISGILNILIGGYVFYLNPKRITNRIFSIIVLFFAIFCIGEFIAKSAGTEELALVGGRICYSVFILAGCLSVHFSIVFPRKYSNDVNPFSRYNYLLLSLYILSIILVIVFNLLVSIKDVQASRWGYSVVLSDSTLFVIFWFIFCTICVTSSLIHTYFRKNITVTEKKQLEFVTIGFIVIAVFGLGTNIIPPLFGVYVFPMTSVSLVLFSIIITYSMIKYKLMTLTTAETADIVVDTMADALIVINENETIVNVNESTLNLLGYQESEILGTPLKQIIKLSENEKRNKRDIFNSSIFKTPDTNGRLKDVELEFVTKDGKIIPMYVSSSIIFGENKKIEGAVIVARELTETKNLINALEESKEKLEEKVKERTKEIVIANKELQIEIKERKNAEKQIRKALREKEVLLKEIHHRVKNNLQIISSLLDLQAGHTDGKKTSDLIHESQNRVKSMALIHEQLYQSENITKVDFKEYIDNLTDNLAYSYGANIKNLSFKIDVKDVLLNLDSAIPCGLIITELVSNSLKHAFPDSKKPEITISFYLNKKNKYVLIMGDNGVGFPKNLDFQNTESLGLQLVNMLTQQLKGTISFDRSEGTIFKIVFPKQM